LKENNKAQCK